MKRHSKKLLSTLLGMMLVLAMMMSACAMSADEVLADLSSAKTLTISGSVRGDENADAVNQVLENSQITISSKTDGGEWKGTIKGILDGAELLTFRACADSTQLVFEIPQVFNEI